jgi:N-acetylglucosaminyldiphosphoundecaprenol N-acetyl-beta-D-mannosaminyltransferase
MNASRPQRTEVLGVRVDCVTYDEALDWCVRSLESEVNRQVVTLNPEFVMYAQRDADFRELVRETDLVVPDGAGIVWAASRQGTTDIERVTGIDLMRSLCDRAASIEVPVFLLGAAPGIAAQAAVVLQEQYPGLEVAGTAVGAPDPEQAPALCAQIRESGAGMLFVAFGCPAQDFWIQQYQEETGALLAMGVGGSFDYISGAVPRAPGWLQRLNLEWLFRLVRQPWRWRRQRALISYVWRVLRERQSA